MEGKGVSEGIFKEGTEDPYRSPVFAIVPGPYYLGMWSLNLPRRVCPQGALGGDLTALVLRRPEEPTIWYQKHRLRYYFEVTAWGDKDKRSWWCGSFSSLSEEQAIAAVTNWLRNAGQIAGESEGPDFVEFKGDSEKVLEILQTNPPKWLHGPRFQKR